MLTKKQVRKQAQLMNCLEMALRQLKGLESQKLEAKTHRESTSEEGDVEQKKD